MQDVLFCIFVVTPVGSSSNQPLEIEEGEAGFALLFPKIDGVKIHTFHFSKDVKNRVFDESKFAEAGMSLFSPLLGLWWCRSFRLQCGTNSFCANAVLMHRACCGSLVLQWVITHRCSSHSMEY